MRIGCLGLSANPPHRGHLDAARVVLNSKKVDEVWFIPVFNHAFGKNLAPWDHRLAMCRLLERGMPHVWTSAVEKEIEEQNHCAASYTVFTVKYLKEKFSAHTFYWCMGSDIVLDRSYLRWHKWPQLARAIEFLVFDKPGYPLGLQPLPEGFTKILGHTTTTSSSLIREKISKGTSIEQDVGPLIDQYIREHNLYKPKEEVVE